MPRADWNVLKKYSLPKPRTACSQSTIQSTLSRRSACWRTSAPAIRGTVRFDEPGFRRIRHRIDHSHEYDRHSAGRLLQCARGCARRSQDDVGGERNRVLPASVPQRVSMRALRPSVQPNCCSACTNAVLRACPSGSSAARFMNTPMRRIRSVCCDRAARRLAPRFDASTGAVEERRA